MKKKIISITLTLILTCAIFLKIGYCCEVDKLHAQYTGTSEFREQLECQLNEYFRFSNYFYFMNRSTSWADGGDLYICLIQEDIIPFIQGGYFKYLKLNNTTNNIKCYRTTLNNLNHYNNEVGINKWGSLQQPTYSATYPYYSSIDIKDNNDTVIYEKSFTYTPPREEGGPVEITNFPISKPEFYMLLVLISTLIFMLFFKWCFPMKGVKKNGK